MISYLEKSFLCNLKLKNYLEDLDSTIMNFEFGSKNNEVEYLFNINIDTYTDNLDKNSFGFGLKGNMFYMNYDFTLNFGGNDTIYTVGSIDFDIMNNEKMRVKNIFNFDYAFNSMFENYDARLGIDFSGKIDDIVIGSKFSKIISGNMNSDDGVNKELDGYSLIPYVEYKLDPKRGSTVYSRYELLDKKFNNQYKNYNNLEVELSLIKDETLVFGL